MSSGIQSFAYVRASPGKLELTSRVDEHVCRAGAADAAIALDAYALMVRGEGHPVGADTIPIVVMC